MREDDLLLSLHRTVSKLDRTMGAICKEHGLTLGQFAVMQALYRCGDQTIGELREAAISSDGTISVVIKNLEKRELVHRKENPRRPALLHDLPYGRGTAPLPRGMPRAQQPGGARNRHLDAIGAKTAS